MSFRKALGELQDELSGFRPTARGQAIETLSDLQQAQIARRVCTPDFVPHIMIGVVSLGHCVAVQLNLEGRVPYASTRLRGACYDVQVDACA